MREDVKEIFKTQQEEIKKVIKSRKARWRESLDKKVGKNISETIGEEKNEKVGRLKREMEEIMKKTTKRGKIG